MTTFLLRLGSSLPIWLRTMLAIAAVPAGFYIGNYLKPGLSLRRFFAITLVVPIVLFVFSRASRHSLLVIILFLISIGFWLGFWEAQPFHVR